MKERGIGDSPANETILLHGTNPDSTDAVLGAFNVAFSGNGLLFWSKFDPALVAGAVLKRKTTCLHRT